MIEGELLHRLKVLDTATVKIVTVGIPESNRLYQKESSTLTAPAGHGQ